jgi:putative membrane protein (TIGR04086 family)
MAAKSSVMRSAPASLVRGLLVSVIVSALLVLLFALLVLLFDLGDGVITPVNQVIKVCSILAGTFVAAQSGMKGWIAGLCLGGAYMLLGIFLYCAFAGEILPPLVMAGDLGLGLAAGFLSGLLAASMKK